MELSPKDLVIAQIVGQARNKVYNFNHWICLNSEIEITPTQKINLFQTLLILKMKIKKDLLMFLNSDLFKEIKYVIFFKINISLIKDQHY